MSAKDIARFLSLAAVSFLATSLFALTEIVNGITWTYSIENGYAVISTGTAYSRAISPAPTGHLAIPETLGGCPVTIGESAFYGCSGITSVSIPDCVTGIGGSSFRGCSSLKSVAIPSTANGINGSAFQDCTSLKSISISSAVRRIGPSAFKDCGKLTDVTIEDGVREIVHSAFMNCSSLTNIVIPSSVMTISNAVFSGCSKLEDITLPFVGYMRGNTRTKDSLFGYIFGVSSYSGGTAVKQYPSTSETDAITYYIPSALRNVVITDEPIIGYGAFRNCNMLTYVALSDRSVNMDDSSFQGCSKLETVLLPRIAETMGRNMFANCSSLTNVVLPRGIPQTRGSQFENCVSLKHVTLPEGLQKIGGAGFRGCSKLDEICIPASVTNIATEAFANCTSLSAVTFEGNAPMLDGTGIFSNINNKMCRGYVKKGSTGWNVDVPGPWNDILLCYYDVPATTWVAENEGLVACYQFNGTVNDTSGYNCRLQRGDIWPLFTVDRFGNASSAILFDGMKKTKIQSIIPVKARAYVENTFSLMFWFQTTSSYLDYGAATEGESHYKGNYAIYPAHSGSTTAQGLGVKVGRDGICLMGHYGGDLPVLMTYSASINANWHHLAVTIQDNSAPILYLDGQKVATGATPTRTMNLGIRIGGDDYGYYTGKLDDVRIYNRALAANEIRTLYEMVESSITYENLMGTTHTNPDVYTEGAYGTFLPPTELTGYEFMGWLPAAISAQTRGGVAVRATWGVPVVCDGSHVTVPLEWLEQSGIDLADGYTNVVVKQSGKVDASGNPMYVWQDYVAGTDPTNTASRFTAAISMTNDVPYITWSPNLNTNGVVRKYTILGKESLTDTADWAPTNSAHRFFKVKVEMP